MFLAILDRNAVFLVLLYQYRVGAYRQKKWAATLRARFTGWQSHANN